jgi:hypothetical protein
MTRMIIALALASACHSESAVPNALECPATTCGATCCSAAADCADDACACPANFVPTMPTFVTGVVVENLPQLPGLHAAIGQFDIAATGKRHAILVAYDPATVPVGVDIDLGATETVKVGFGYDISAEQKIRSSYRIMSGTLRLTSACATGVAGTVRGEQLSEIDIFDNLALVPNGCTFALPDATFAVAGACP